MICEGCYHCKNWCRHSKRQATQLGSNLLCLTTMKKKFNCSYVYHEKILKGLFMEGSHSSVCWTRQQWRSENEHASPEKLTQKPEAYKYIQRDQPKKTTARRLSTKKSHEQRTRITRSRQSRGFGEMNVPRTSPQNSFALSRSTSLNKHKHAQHCGDVDLQSWRSSRTRRIRFRTTLHWQTLHGFSESV